MITFATIDPASLLTAFKKAIDARKVKTWVDDNDSWFSHVSTQWADKAVLQAEFGAGALRFRILVRDKVPLSERRSVYAFYNAHLIETFINHFSASFTAGSASSNPGGQDNAKLQAA